jgi:hypothetical protein
VKLLLGFAVVIMMMRPQCYGKVSNGLPKGAFFIKVNRSVYCLSKKGIDEGN